MAVVINEDIGLVKGYQRSSLNHKKKNLPPLSLHVLCGLHEER